MRRFEKGTITNDGYLDNKRCIYKDIGCGNWCPHFGEPEEVIVSNLHIAKDFTPIQKTEKTGRYQLKICQCTLLDLGKIIL